MHPQASSSKDSYDRITPPRFVSYLEWNTRHQEFFSPWFTRDIVPSVDTYTWTFLAESNREEKQTELTWNPMSLGENDAQLFLLDVAGQSLIDMKKVGRYNFNMTVNREFKIYFSKDKESLRPDLTIAGLAYPNPMSTSATIPFIVSEKAGIQISVYDLQGRKIKDVVSGMFDAGVHQALWDRTDSSGMPVASGLYLYRMSVNGNTTVMKRLLVN